MNDASRHAVEHILAEARGLRDALLSRRSEPENGAKSAEEFFADLRPHLASLGITRVGDLTGLDTLGFPVWFATRPNSRALSVSQGKGMDHHQARISAVMEAIECAVAERPETLATRICSWDEMRKSGAAMPLDRQMRCAARPQDGRLQAWVPGLSLRSGRTVFAPYELIGLDLRADVPEAEYRCDRSTFRMSSIGLGAGGSLAQATLHAVLELVENAATAPLEMFGLRQGLARPVRHRLGAHGGLDAAVARLAESGLTCSFFDLTDRSGLPVIGAFIPRPVQDDVTGQGERFCAGFACRLDPSEAALAALLEAVQSRLTDIAGSRDDIEPGDYTARELRLPAASPRAAAIDALAQPIGGGLEARLRVVLDAVFATGALDVTLFPLPAEDLVGEASALRVVRVLVPGLAAAANDGVMQIGADGLDRLLGLEAPR